MSDESKPEQRRPINLNIDPSLDRLPARPWDHHLTASHTQTMAPRHSEPEDLTLYAMQMILGQEAAAIAHHLEYCAECTRELAHIRSDLGAYAFTVESNQPSDRARQRLLRQVSREKRLPPTSSSSSVTIPVFDRANSVLKSVEEQPQRTERHIGRTIFAWSGWAIAAGLAVVAGLLYRDSGAMRANLVADSRQLASVSAEAESSRRLMQALTDPKAMRVTLTTKPAPAKREPVAGATYNSDKGTLVFLANGLDPLETYKTYELWLIPADGAAPMPAGTFHPDDHGNASVIMPDLPKGVPAKGFGVTIEDEGGSPTPTKPIVMSGF